MAGLGALSTGVNNLFSFFQKMLISTSTLLMSIIPNIRFLDKQHILNRHWKKTKESVTFKLVDEIRKHPSQFHWFIHPIYFIKTILMSPTKPHCVHKQGNVKVFCFKFTSSIGVAPHFYNVPNCYFLRIIIKKHSFDIISAYPTFDCYKNQTPLPLTRAFQFLREEGRKQREKHIKARIIKLYSATHSYISTKYAVIYSLLWHFFHFELRYQYQKCTLMYERLKAYFFPSPPTPDYWE